ncbi:MAG: type II toxin-antitoxin system HigB family toxin [Flavobacteriales bacterium]|nr:type II toxin-antitoxin system HigB family toxin [Flavobacteriales bacterium]
MRIIARKTLKEFWEKHGDCEQQLKAWYDETLKAQWKTPREIKKEYPTASFLSDNRIVFNIKGNNYRLVVKLNYKYSMVWIRFIGSHAEYDRIDAKNI